MKHKLQGQSMKRLFLVLGVVMFGLFGTTAKAEDDMKAYDFSFDALMGGEKIELKNYQGQVMMIVNTASKCGFTGQYDGLQKLYDSYKAQGFVVIGVPSDNFGGQEFADAEEIAEFCRLNYGVTFPMSAPEDVKGANAHPFYVWAEQKLGATRTPKWNFHKYLINRKGEFVDYFASTTAPDARRLTRAVEELLAENISE